MIAHLLEVIRKHRCHKIKLLLRLFHFHILRCSLESYEKKELFITQIIPSSHTHAFSKKKILFTSQKTCYSTPRVYALPSYYNERPYSLSNFSFPPYMDKQFHYRCEVVQTKFFFQLFNLLPCTVRSSRSSNNNNDNRALMYSICATRHIYTSIGYFNAYMYTIRITCGYRECSIETCLLFERAKQRKE